MNLLFLSLFLILAPQSATSAAKRAPDARTQVHRNQEAKPDDRAAAIDDSVVFPAKVVNTAVAPDVPISIIRTPPRDRYDWITWGGGVLLSLVGIGGVIVAVGTLRFIKRQVIEMRRQGRVMHRTLQSIEKQA